MNSKRFFYIMVGITAFLGTAILGAVYVGNNILVKQANTLKNHKLESQVAEQQQTLLTKAKKDIAKYSNLKDAAKQVVPQDKDQAAAVREIVNIARDSGITLGSITFPSSTLGQKTAPTTTSETTDKSATATPDAKKKPQVTQVDALNGIPGVYVMPITIRSSSTGVISYNAFIYFLQRLENNRRTAQVSSITITPDRKTGSLSFSLILNAYIKPKQP
jgi:hypothetical protein